MVKSDTSLLDQPEVCYLRGLLARHEHPSQRQERPYFSSGCRALDRVLPEGGIRTGSLVEWIGDGPGSGISLLPLVAVRAVQQDGGAVVVVDRQCNFYPPAAAAWGIDLGNVVVVHPDNDSDELWAIDQAIRCADVAAVLAWPHRLDSYTFRRLQLAAESSGAIGLLVRPARAEQEPTWANLRLKVSPQPSALSPMSPKKLPEKWRWTVKVLRCRGLFASREMQLEVDLRTGEIDETSFGDLATELATATLSEQTA